MRNKVVIPTIVLAVLLMVGGFYLHHRAKIPVPVAHVSKTLQRPSMHSVRTSVVPAARSGRSQTELEFSDSRQPEVRFPTIRMIVDLNADTLSRQKAVRALPRDLFPEHRKVLTDFLAARHPEDDGQGGHVLKNDIMDALIGQKTPGRGLADLFIGIYQDKSQNIVIRDYALQHLALLSERLDGPMIWDSGLVQTQQKLIQETLWQCAEARDSSMAGTALLGLTRISETHSDFDRNRLGQAAIAMTDAGVDEAARVTAFQVCARLRVSNALPLTINAAQTDSSSIVRISAIGALGLFGNVDQVPILNQIAERNARFKAAAVLAMKKIQEKTR
jgi:hypothetical protein